MKKLSLVFVIAVACLTGCDEVAKLTQFDIAYDEEVVIPATAAVNLPFDVSTPAIETNAESKFSVNDTKADLVEEVYLNKITLSLSAPEDGDFSFLESIEVFISAEGLDEVSIAAVTDIPDDIGKSLELDTSKENLKEYIMQDQFQLRFSTTTDKLIDADQHVDVASVFMVDAKILGL